MHDATTLSKAWWTQPIGACLVLLCASSCGVSQVDRDLRQVQLKRGYSLEQLQDDLASIRATRWPERGMMGVGGEDHWWRSLRGLGRAFAEADWTGVTRDAALRMLGPADGELAYRDVEVTWLLDLEGETREVKEMDKEPYLVEPSDDRLIYRTGDGSNHNTIYALLFRDGKVSEVNISVGY
ncbi:MAG: hypothetical protein ACYS9X_10965 [Planctomycetota bacterium]|jgi:hypothetical protein